MKSKQWIAKPYRTLREPNYGMILCAKVKGEIYFALVKRRSSYGLMHILRGDYKPQYFAELSRYEKTELLRICNLNSGWEQSFADLCISIAEPVYTDLYHRYLDVFLNNRANIQVNLNSSPVMFPYGVWDFPKGKREKHETELECALRELHEETEITSTDITVCDIKLPVENFNGWLYQYYVCLLNDDVVENRVKDEGEISDLVWCSFDDAVRLIPEVMDQRRNQLKHVYDLMNT
jgi:8-oxo-dGTP pyrophosphatase MutT (NUDIX family)